ncbi:MAG: hypothetical protein JRN67_01300 [Nitrososphaerota archaeon]|nr:hypothetical protein [Nitrososphaerota archaeon]
MAAFELRMTRALTLFGSNGKNSEGAKGTSEKASNGEETGSPLASLRSKIGRRSRLGSVALLVLSVALLVLSYQFRGIVLEVNSVVAFVAGLVLLFRDVRHAVQSRVVDRILLSNAEFVQSLSPNLRGTGFSYVTRGLNASDVVVVPSAEAERFFRKDSLNSKALTELIPPGKGLAELFAREIDDDNPTLDKILRQAPIVISDRFDLASSTVVRQDNDNLEFVLVHPTLDVSCDGDGKNSNSKVGCPICSLIATVVCTSSKRETLIENCSRDQIRDALTVRLRLGRSFPDGVSSDE